MWSNIFGLIIVYASEQRCLQLNTTKQLPLWLFRLSSAQVLHCSTNCLLLELLRWRAAEKISGLGCYSMLFQMPTSGLCCLSHPVPTVAVATNAPGLVPANVCWWERLGEMVSKSSWLPICLRISRGGALAVRCGQIFATVCVRFRTFYTTLNLYRLIPL